MNTGVSVKMIVSTSFKFVTQAYCPLQHSDEMLKVRLITAHRGLYLFTFSVQCLGSEVDLGFLVLKNSYFQ